jgi:hypothetical protein
MHRKSDESVQICSCKTSIMALDRPRYRRNDNIKMPIKETFLLLRYAFICWVRFRRGYWNCVHSSYVIFASHPANQKANFLKLTGISSTVIECRDNVKYFCNSGYRNLRCCAHLMWHTAELCMSTYSVDTEDGEWSKGDGKGEGERNDILLMQVANRLLCWEGAEWSK